MKVYVRGYRIGKGRIGRFIGWFTFGLYKHVSIIFVWDTGRTEEFESTARHGVHFSKVEENTNTDYFYASCTHEQGYSMLAAAMKISGAKYDRMGIWGFVRRKKRENPNRWFCSEAAAYVLDAGGVTLMRLPFWKQSPVMTCSSIAIVPIDDPLLKVEK